MTCLLGWVAGVKPEHVGVVLRESTCQRMFWSLPLCQAWWTITHIIPDGHDQNHGLLESLVHLREPTDLGEAVAVAECLELVGTELRGDVAAGGDALYFGEYAHNTLIVTSNFERGGGSLTVSAGAGIWIVFPSCTKNWESLFCSNRVTTLQHQCQFLITRSTWVCIKCPGAQTAGWAGVLT